MGLESYWRFLSIASEERTGARVVASYTDDSRGVRLQGGHVSGTRSSCGHCLPAVHGASA